MRSEKGIAIVTGATSGLGLALAYDLMRANYSVYALGKSEYKKQQIELDFKEHNSHVLCFDLMNKDAILEFCSIIKEVQIVVLCAGILVPDTASSAAISAMLDINLYANKLLISALLPKIPKNKNSWIWVVTSSSIEKPYPNQTHYASTKLKLQLYTNELRKQLAYTHPFARVTEINPGGILTNLHQQFNLSSQVESNYMSADEVARSISSLLLNLGKSIQIPYISVARRPK
ncbi:MAG: SDR family NAD(P)-dependent oxidoreductase [bacterium]|nr:SDR family NAD(P)-dependent oxidoreductase [bacterium]